MDLGSFLLTGPNCSNLQEMLANLQDTEDISPLQPPSRSTASKVSDEDLGRSDDGNLTEHLLFPSVESVFETETGQHADTRT